MEVTLTIHSVEGTREVPMQGTRLTLGRTGDADVVINDSSLSRVHASINRDGDRVWIVDEGSTHGTSVNGTGVPATGSPLADNDEVYLGNTTVVVKFRTGSGHDAAKPSENGTASPDARRLPVALIAAAASIVIILFAAIIVGLAYRSGENEPITVRKYNPANDNETTTNSDANTKASPSGTASPAFSPDAADNTSERDVSVAPTKL